MKKFLFTISIILFGFISNAQIIFQKTYGGSGYDEGYCAMQTFDGGYIVTGRTASFGAGNFDVYLIKTDIYGNLAWTKTFGGSGDDCGYYVQQTADSGYIISGSTKNFGSSNSDVYLIKTNAYGILDWKKCISGGSIDIGNSVQQTADGGYVVAGRTPPTGVGNYVYLIKTNATGDTLWTKMFGYLIGGAYANSVQQTSDGGYIITGASNFGTQGDKIYLIKTDTIGNATWVKNYGFAGPGSEYGYSVKQTTDGGYIVLATTSSLGAGANDAYLIKTDAYGDTLWSKTYGGIGNDYANSVQQTADGGFIFSGLTWSPGLPYAYMARTDSIGNLLWSKTYGRSATLFNSVYQTSDGGFIFTSERDSVADNNVYLIKTDSLGNSGCYQANFTMTVTSPAPEVTTPPTTVISGGIVTIPIALSGSGGNVATLCTTVGISETIHGNTFVISPNPSAGNFFILFAEVKSKVTVEVLNFLGESVLKTNIFNESKKEINLKNITEGIYFVKVYDGEKSYCKKLIIE